MRYLCLIHFDEQALAAMPEPQLNALNAAHLRFNDELRQSGRFIAAEALDAPATARVLRLRDGKPVVTDGPFAETKEMIAGFYLIDAEDLDAAARFAAQLPVAPLATIEVRPARQLTVDGKACGWAT